MKGFGEFMKDRNQGFFQSMPGMPMNQGVMNEMIPSNMDFERRIDTLERQIKRLDARVNRLETPNKENYNASIQTTDNTGFSNPMYMM